MFQEFAKNGWELKRNFGLQWIEQWVKGKQLLICKNTTARRKKTFSAYIGRTCRKFSTIPDAIEWVEENQLIFS